jgi:hypothetical protein
MTEEAMIPESSMNEVMKTFVQLNTRILELEGMLEIEQEKSRISQEFIDSLTKENLHVRSQLNFLNKKISQANNPIAPEKKTEQKDDLLKKDQDNSKENNIALDSDNNSGSSV